MQAPEASIIRSVATILLTLALIPTALAGHEVEIGVDLGGDRIELGLVSNGTDPTDLPAEARIRITPLAADLNGGPYAEPCVGVYQNAQSVDYRRVGGACAGAHPGCPAFVILPVGDGFCVSWTILHEFP